MSPTTDMTIATLDNSPIELDETDTARAEAELMESV